jgi:pimeloyl-ACP methyl ester carboxylesterase
LPISPHSDEPRSERFTANSVSGVTLHARHFGQDESPLLILLHGGGANSHWWDHLAPTLSESFHVVALDFRGHGDSLYPEGLEVSAFDRDLDALLEHLGAPEAILMGHSMGARVAVSGAARRNDIRAVVAFEISRGAQRGDRRRARLALAARRTYSSFEEAARRFQFVPAAHGVDESLRASIARWSVREESDGRFGFKFDARWFTVPSSDPPDLAQIACPTLVLRGADSGLLTPEGAAELIASIPDARCVEITGGGHNAHVERPVQFLAAVTAFLTPFR